MKGVKFHSLSDSGGLFLIRTFVICSLHTNICPVTIGGVRREDPCRGDRSGRRGGAEARNVRSSHKQRPQLPTVEIDVSFDTTSGE